MDWVFKNLWLIPSLPLLAAGLSALAPQRQRTLAASLAVGSMVVSLVLSCVAFAGALAHSGHGETSRQVVSFPWFQLYGDKWVKLGWGLDPLTAVRPGVGCLVRVLLFHSNLRH